MAANPATTPAVRPGSAMAKSRTRTAGCDVVTVQRALRHRTASVTLNTYSHLWPSAEDKTRNAAGAMLAETLTGVDLCGLAGGGRAATCQNTPDG